MSLGKPLILLSNDDGVRAPGIPRRWPSALADVGEVIVAAPGSRAERRLALASASTGPLRVERGGAERLRHRRHAGRLRLPGAHHLVPRKPDLCLSGINNGFNLGSDVFYSGTVGAALEGALRGRAGAWRCRWSGRGRRISATPRLRAPRWCATSWPGARRHRAGDPAQREPSGRPVRGLRATCLGRRIYRDQVDGAPGSARPDLLLDRRPGGEGRRSAGLRLHAPCAMGWRR